jgi:hypothetical protein
MPQEDPSIQMAPVIFPRPVTGYRRQVQIAHPFTGVLNLLTNDAHWGDALQPNYVTYAYTPPSGPKQKTIHTAGPDEVTWSVSGELANSSIGLANLLDSNARGVQFQNIIIAQGANDVYYFSNSNGYSLPWSNFTLTGAQNAAVTFSLEGRSTQLPAPYGTSGLALLPDVPVPSWFTGNDFVLSWSISHAVNLTPKWTNTTSSLPFYYRPGVSEYTIQVTTAVALVGHSMIRFGIGGVSLVEAVITSRNRVLGERNAPASYQVTTTNVRIVDQNAYLPSAVINIYSGPLNAGFDY